MLFPLLVDIDECMTSMELCDPNANCTNTPGSYTCACNQGYSGNGTTCDGELLVIRGLIKELTSKHEYRY